MNPVPLAIAMSLALWTITLGTFNIGVLFPPKDFVFSGGQFCMPKVPVDNLCVHHCTPLSGNDLTYETIAIDNLTQQGCVELYNSCQLLKSLCEVGFAHPIIPCVCTSTRKPSKVEIKR